MQTYVYGFVVSLWPSGRRFSFQTELTYCLESSEPAGTWGWSLLQIPTPWKLFLLVSSFSATFCMILRPALLCISMFFRVCHYQMSRDRVHVGGSYFECRPPQAVVLSSSIFQNIFSPDFTVDPLFSCSEEPTQAAAISPTAVVLPHASDG